MCKQEVVVGNEPRLSRVDAVGNTCMTTRVRRNNCSKKVLRVSIYGCKRLFYYKKIVPFGSTRNQWLIIENLTYDNTLKKLKLRGLLILVCKFDHWNIAT